MRVIFFTTIFFISFSVNGQTGSFPKSWTGNWKGVLEWYKTGTATPQKVTMELRIHPADSAGMFTWQIIYGSATVDNRPYLLKPKDTARGRWVIDEGNGIVLDQFWLGNKFCGAFTVNGNTILNSYWIDNDKMVAEFYGVSAKPVSGTGNGTPDSPKIDIYWIGSYQKAILKRTK